MSRTVRRICGVLALALLAQASLTAQSTPGPESKGSAGRLLAVGEIHKNEVRLDSGQFLRVVVEQNHLDAVVRIFSAEGTILAQTDNAADREDPLSISLVAPHEGIYRVEIQLQGRKSAPGRYRLRMEPPRAASPDDEKRMAAERSRGEADHLMARNSAESFRQALEAYEKVLASWREIGDRREEAATLGRMSDALGELGDLRPALARAEEALALWRLEKDRRGEGAALARLGLAYSEVGQQKPGIELLEQSLALRREEGNLRGQAETLNYLAVALGAMGEKAEAIARYTEALDFARAAGDRAGEAMLLKNRALDYMGIGETERALVDLRDALARFRGLHDRHLEGVTQYSLGATYRDRNELPQALAHYEAALPFLREAGDKRFEGFTNNHMGLVHLAAGRPERALPYLERARELLHASGDQRAEPMILANIGRAHLEKGDASGARDMLAQALPLVRATGDHVHEAMVLVQLARAQRSLGDLETARGRLEEALSLTESLRGSIPGAGERASYMAKTRDRYDLLIDVLMDLHARQPEKGWDAEALHASERAKARSLVELLAEARIDLREGVDETLLVQEHSLESQIETRRHEQEQRLINAKSDSSESGGRALDALLTDYQEVEGRLRAASPRFAALVRPEPLDWSAIRDQVLDPDTLLLEYALGEERSFLWAGTVSGLSVYRLPSRGVVESAARRLYQAWSVSGAVDPAEAGRRARALSRMLLGPVANRLRGPNKPRRLAIVAEGAIQYIPFAALPSPGSGGSGKPLVSQLEVVSLPSATTLAVLRRQESGQKATGPRVAVLADPVFDRSDPRIRGGHVSVGAQGSNQGSDALTRSMQETGLRRLERLTASRREAQEIAALAGPHEVFTALDFRANRSTALGEEVSNARILHLASHGLLNTRHPELSGIVLSLVDEKGRPVDGFLQTRDIYKLKLSASLVVLSACQTALGKDVRGEGLLGLSRGFMYAGAPRVVASLWEVPDGATAELMKRLYRGILVDGLRPAAALRDAQAAIRAEKLWSSPYYWAAFTLQGDWN